MRPDAIRLETGGAPCRRAWGLGWGCRGCHRGSWLRLFLSIIAIAASTVTVKMLSAESIRKNYYTARESVDIVLLFLAIQLTEAFTLMTLIC